MHLYVAVLVGCQGDEVVWCLEGVQSHDVLQTKQHCNIEREDSVLQAAVAGRSAGAMGPDRVYKTKFRQASCWLSRPAVYVPQSFAQDAVSNNQRLAAASAGKILQERTVSRCATLPF